MLDEYGENGYGYYRVEVKAGEKTEVTVYENPSYFEIELRIKKESADYREKYNTLNSGVKFEVSYFGGDFESKEEALESGCTKRRWVLEVKKEDEGYFARFDEEHLVLGDELYKNDNGKIILPLGTFLIEEISFGDGYLPGEQVFLNDSGDVLGQSVLIRTSDAEDEPGGKCGNISVMLTCRNSLPRADIKIRKSLHKTGEPMPDVLFELENIDTGEKFIIETDENGECSTHSSYLSHLEESGVWFGESMPDDSKCALVPERYALTEIRTGSNHTMKMEKIFFEVTSADEGRLFEYDIVNREIWIGTSASDKEDGDREVDIGDNVEIVDTVSYENLTPGKTYTLIGKAVDRDTLRGIVNEGKEITSVKEFTPEADFGEVEVEFCIDTGEFSGKKLVFFEELFEGCAGDISDSAEPLAVHKDIENEMQTIKVREQTVREDPGEVPLITPEPVLRNEDAAKTGDEGYLTVLLCAGVMAMCVVAFLSILILKKKK